MNILFICPRFPYPPLKGDIVRVYNQIKYLSEKHSITLICFVRTKNELDYVGEIERYCKQVKTVAMSTARSYLNMAKAVFSNLPLQVLFYRSRKMRQVITSTVNKDNFDLVHINMVRMAPYISALHNLPVVVDMIDAGALNMQRRYEKERIFLKPIVWMEKKRVEKYEKNICRKVDYALVVSKIDRQIIGSQYKVAVNPNGVDLDRADISPQDKITNSIIFSGNMGYFPNVDAVLYFTKEIFPWVKERFPDVKFYIVGANPHSDIKVLNNEKDIFVTGFVDDIKQYLGSCQVSVCPMRSGSGIQNKVLEAMSCRTPVVATNCALEGIEAVPDRDIIIENKPREFAIRVVELLNSSSKRHELSLNGRKLVEEKYSWKKSVYQLERIYEDVLMKKRKDQGY